MTPNADCIFCKIVSKQLPAKIRHEDNESVAFDDINPKERVHILIVPKKHIPTIADMQDNEETLMGHLVKVARDLAKSNGCPGYKLMFFVGKEGGQEVFHVHLHLMGK